MWIAVFAFVVVVPAVLVPQPALFVITFVGVAFAWRCWRAKVVARPDGLLVVNRLRTTRVAWSEVSTIGLEDDTHLWRFPYGGPTRFSKGTLAVGVVTLVDGTRLECDAVMSMTRSERWGFGGPTAAETKVALLERFRQTVGG